MVTELYSLSHDDKFLQMRQMNSKRSQLESLGWNEQFEESLAPGTEDPVARVAAVDRKEILLADQNGSFRAKLAGRYLHYHKLPEEMPCVGDWACYEKRQGDEFAIVHSILQRRTLLRRKSAGDEIDCQMIAANIDFVMIVQSCHFDFNVRRLERYLVMAMDGGADPIILMTKTDLIDSDTLASHLAEIRSAGISAPILPVSNLSLEGLDELKRLMSPGKTYCFVGGSGVGKSTMINHLIGSETQDTNTVSGTGEGRHTTVRRELIRLEGGAIVIDNPGMREFGVFGADGGISLGYSEIVELSSSCRYRDCSHNGEPGCAVADAVLSGEISQSHFENYVKLKKESEFHQMSYAEKRKKDKVFGKHVKTVKKGEKSGRRV